ncbi:MAG: 6-diaminopimelate ligase [Candidatus Tokpelaia sp. JSC161]|jgi:UDP-N-acetylmuramoyl-L-alanyl-D-glutamate--2,6-diaminopimelate ligase|nr:MAG: 6-diaminopimelate ligase [Candidatus Tokpelaia sp. JSC161]
MNLADLIETNSTLPMLRVTALTSDSRKVVAGSLFFSLNCHVGDAYFYATDAEKRGAVAVVIASGANLPNLSVPVIRVDDVRLALACAASRFYKRQPEVITAVTGTCGKTSVVSFLRQIWNHNGFSAASIGTIGIISQKIMQSSSLTTPEPLELHSFLKELSSDGVTHVAIEASSHGIKQRRLDGLRLTAAAFTNFGRDHIDYHITIEDYFNAKMRLFDKLLPHGAPAVVYSDNRYSTQVIEHIGRGKHHVLTVGRRGEFIRVIRVEYDGYRQYLDLECDGHIYDVALPLFGEFQMANAVMAAGLAIAIGESPAAAFRALERIKGAPGRLDFVAMTHTGAYIYIDYAHKPDALENALKSLRSLTIGRILLVFGCGGDRDKGKRRIMGAIAVRFAEIVIVTDDNPRREDPAIIRKQILLGASGAIEISDRREAIYKAISMLESGDTLIVAGKGHEEGQIIGNQFFPFSDYFEIYAALGAYVK